MADKVHEAAKDMGRDAAKEAAAPPLDLNAPDIRKAIEEAAAREVAKLFAAAQGGATQTPGQPADRAFIEGLTLSLAELAGQGSGRVYTAPEVIKDRLEARERMIQLCLKAWDAKTPPAYIITGKVLLDNQLIEPFWLGPDRIARPTEIDWYGIPNDAMEPINAIAKAIKKEFIDSVGTIKKASPADRIASAIFGGRAAVDKYGMTYKGLVVRNGAVPSAAGVRAPTVNLPEATSEDGMLSIHGKNAPGTLSKQPVLGSIFTPANLPTSHPASPKV